jgi:hypothetical protein
MIAFYLAFFCIILSFLYIVYLIKKAQDSCNQIIKICEDAVSSLKDGRG